MWGKITVNIILIGSEGTMGSCIKKIIKDSNQDQLVAVVDKHLKTSINSDYRFPNIQSSPLFMGNIEDFINYSNNRSACVCADVIIDFSTEIDKTNIINFAAKNKLPLASFSTNWSCESLSFAKDYSNKIPILINSNASIGANAMFDAIDILTNKLKNADIVISEYHHKHKKDSPSGTAKQLAKIISKNKKDFSINSNRVSNECGIHKVDYFIEDEIVTIYHQAKSKSCFAIGALNMAKKLTEKESGLYTSL